MKIRFVCKTTAGKGKDFPVETATKPSDVIELSGAPSVSEIYLSIESYI